MSLLTCECLYVYCVLFNVVFTRTHYKNICNCIDKQKCKFFCEESCTCKLICCVIEHEELPEDEDDMDVEEDGEDEAVAMGAHLPPQDWDHFPGMHFPENRTYIVLLSLSLFPPAPLWCSDD